MITKINTIKGSFEDDILLFKEVTPKKLNILFGGNGVGKTTFLNGIVNSTLKIESSDKYDVLSFVNSQNNFKHNNPHPFDNEFNNKLIQKVESGTMSEGQSIIFSVIDFFKKVKEKSSSTKNTIVVILDEVDSGLSAENINMILHFIAEITNEYNNVQFFISSNAYHFVYVFKTVLSMYNGKFITINSYEKFYQILTENMVQLGQKGELKFLRNAKFIKK